MTLGTVVLTGAAGRLGAALRAPLSAQCAALRLLDRAPLQAERVNETVYRAELTDASALRDAMHGAQAVVHFAGYPREADWPTLLAANVAGVAALWDAARDAGVQRIVYASSNHAVGFYPRSVSIDHTDLPLADSRYGVTKVFMEALAACYAEKYGLAGFGIRIGSCTPVPGDARSLAHWIHPDDLAALVVVGLGCPSPHEVVFGVSNNARSWYDNRRALELGYQPRHSADAWAEGLAAQTTGNPISEHFQGGSFAAQEHRHAPVPAQ